MTIKLPSPVSATPVGLEKSGSGAGDNVVRYADEVALAIESGIGGDDAGGGINEINAVAPGIANGQQAVLFYNDALQGSAGIGDGGDNIADAEPDVILITLLLAVT